MSAERKYQRELIGRIRSRFPGCKVFKNDPLQEQGIPDLLILHGGRWAMLEVKMDDSSPTQPNQAHHVAAYNDMSYAAFIHPGNEEEILNDLQSTFGSCGAARVS